MKKPTKQLNSAVETGSRAAPLWGSIRRIESVECPIKATEMVRAGWWIMSAARKNGQATFTIGSMLDPDTAQSEADTLLDRTPAAAESGRGV